MAEALAIHDVFGNRPMPVTAAKGCLGNLGAGSGAVELIAGILALRQKMLFPTQNFSMSDPDCPVSPVQDAATSPGNSFIKIAFNPQAQASAILVRN
jgi:3-oxoacyl-[acyl-carrier-protein] synthase II